MDQTGQLICLSISGNKCLFILCDYGSNYMYAVPMPSKTKHQILIAYQKSIKFLKRRGLKPQLQRLDNEASDILREFMQDKDIKFQLTPAGLHRRNNTERAIHTFRNYFIAGLCSTPPNFPMNLWDKLIPQELLTLNLLRLS